MKKNILIIISLLFTSLTKAQYSIQASIQHTQYDAGSIDIVYKPTYTSRNGEFVNYVCISIAVPAGKISDVKPSITGKDIFSKLSFTKATPFGYQKDNEIIYSWICNNQVIKNMSWQLYKSFIGATITFKGTAGVTKIEKAKLVDYTNSQFAEGTNSFCEVITNRSDNQNDQTGLFFSIEGPGGSKSGRNSNADQYVEFKPTTGNNSNEQKIAGLDKDGSKKFSIESVFPNPAQTQITLLITAPIKDKATILLTDVTGRTINQHIVDVKPGSNRISLDVAGLATGSYIVKLICLADCETAVGKFNKQ